MEMCLEGQNKHRRGCYLKDMVDWEENNIKGFKSNLIQTNLICEITLILIKKPKVECYNITCEEGKSTAILFVYY